MAHILVDVLLVGCDGKDDVHLVALGFLVDLTQRRVILREGRRCWIRVIGKMESARTESPT